MLWQNARLLIIKTVAVDVLTLVGSFCLAFWARDTLLPFIFPDQFLSSLFSIKSYVWMLFVILPTWVCLYAAFGLYQPFRLATFRRLPIDITKANGIGLALLVGVTYVLKIQDVSRSLVFMFGFAGLVMTIGSRLMIRRSVQRSGRGRAIVSNVIIVGTGAKALEFAELVQQNLKWGFRLLGFIAESKDGDCPDRVGQYRVLGNVWNLESILKTNVVDEVIFVVHGRMLMDMEELFLLCEELGVNTRIAVGLFPHLIARATLDELGKIPLLTFTTKPTDWLALAAKRVMDLVIAWPVLIVGMPVWLLIALLIKIDSPGSVFFRQERCGINGHRFMMYKFRSMVCDAEARFKEVAALNEIEGPAFKVRNDPRITRVGRWLRRTSFDEIPQLINVVHGEMSIVGPRPPLVSEVEKYERWQRRRLSMKPGLTCLWAIRGRNAVPFDQWMKLDLDYIDNWSLWLDCQILLKTIPAVLSGRGSS